MYIKNRGVASLGGKGGSGEVRSTAKLINSNSPTIVNAIKKEDCSEVNGIFLIKLLTCLILL